MEESLQPNENREPASYPANVRAGVERLPRTVWLLGLELDHIARCRAIFIITAGSTIGLCSLSNAFMLRPSSSVEVEKTTVMPRSVMLTPLPPLLAVSSWPRPRASLIVVRSFLTDDLAEAGRCRHRMSVERERLRDEQDILGLTCSPALDKPFTAVCHAAIPALTGP
ncbi:hypothetical protein B0I37DRAFT_14238 [Chaetomium sp. MPI-CAGE-AT-0009]|nr:hypothetical protein B0I37DRAFT_14238 [Chaetomium sp. MPI-CAGE-AT-0009]